VPGFRHCCWPLWPLHLSLANCLPLDAQEAGVPLAAPVFATDPMWFIPEWLSLLSAELGYGTLHA
jgi:hypothetical protein